MNDTSVSPSTSCVSSSGSSYTEKEIIIFNKFNPPTSCFVCGSPAKCHHYNIPSCSGCKTFFRRSILTTPNYICKNDKCCQNLKGCRACRFDRCLMVGMNPNGILIPPKSNVYQIQSFIKKHQNRMFSKATLQRSHNEMPRLFTVLGLEQNKSLQYLLYLESKICLLRMSGDYNPVQLFECSVKDLMKKEVELAKTDKYSIVSKHQGIKLYLLIDIILCMDASRLLPGMDEMEERDLELILKHCGLMLAIFTQSFYSYQHHFDTLTLPNGSVPMRCMKQKTRLELDCFCRCIEPVARSKVTMEEYCLAKAIALFNPAIPGLSSQAQIVLTSQRKMYAKILLKHEQDNYGSAPGAVKYTEIISTIEAMYHFTQRQREFHTICHMQFMRGLDSPWPKTFKLKLFEDSVI